MAFHHYLKPVTNHPSPTAHCFSLCSNSFKDVNKAIKSANFHKSKSEVKGVPGFLFVLILLSNITAHALTIQHVYYRGCGQLK